MSGSFGIHMTIRKRPRDNRGRVTCKGARNIVEHAGHYMEKICESLSLPREWYPKHYGRFQVVSFGARWLTRELKDEFDKYGDISILGRLNRSRNRPGRRVRCNGHSLLVLHTAAAQGGAQAVKRRDEVAVGVDVPLASVVDRSSN